MACLSRERLKKKKQAELLESTLLKLENKCLQKQENAESREREHTNYKKAV